jgi:hypothetical protein
VREEVSRDAEFHFRLYCTDEMRRASTGERSAARAGCPSSDSLEMARTKNSRALRNCPDSV